MRPGQQKNRGRGRGSNNNGGGGGGGGNNFNRKGGNPLSRTYDSSGPDIKIRGTAQHIAEKYATLARDAQSSGDRVMAENYLQHAEHYNRIIAAAQAQMQDRFQHQDRGDYQDGNGLDQDDMDNGDGDGDDLSYAQQPVVSNEAPQQQQPRREQQNQQNQNNGQQPRENRRDRGDRDQRRDRRQDRPERREQPVAEDQQAVVAATVSEEQPVVAAKPAPAKPIPAPAVDDGSGPQPDIVGTPAEVAVEQAEQAEAATERAPRRRAAARPRRQPRKSAEGEDGAANDDSQPALAEAAGE